jgi:hypothetical protein
MNAKPVEKKEEKETFYIDVNIIWAVQKKLVQVMKMFYKGLEPRIYEAIDASERNNIEGKIHFRLIDLVLAHIEPRMHNPIEIIKPVPETQMKSSVREPESNFTYEVVDGPNGSPNYVNAEPEVLEYILNYELYLPLMMLGILRENREDIRNLFTQLIKEKTASETIQISNEKDDFVFNYKSAILQLRKEGKKITQKAVAEKMKIGRTVFQAKLPGFDLKWDSTKKILTDLDGKQV